MSVEGAAFPTAKYRLTFSARVIFVVDFEIAFFVRLRLPLILALEVEGRLFQVAARHCTNCGD